MGEREVKLKCPCCGTIMDKIDKDGVIIDRCPNCFGIYLDKGELDKIVMMKREKFSKDQKDVRKKWGYPRPGCRPPSEDFDWFYESPQDDKSKLPSD